MLSWDKQFCRIQCVPSFYTFLHRPIQVCNSLASCLAHSSQVFYGTSQFRLIVYFLCRGLIDMEETTQLREPQLLGYCFRVCFSCYSSYSNYDYLLARSVFFTRVFFFLVGPSRWCRVFSKMT